MWFYYFYDHGKSHFHFHLIVQQPQPGAQPQRGASPPARRDSLRHPSSTVGLWPAGPQYLTRNTPRPVCLSHSPFPVPNSKQRASVCNTSTPYKTPRSTSPVKMETSSLDLLEAQMESSSRQGRKCLAIIQQTAASRMHEDWSI